MEKQSILIVDSEDAIRDNLSSRFNDIGMLTITAKDGFEGYTRACKESPNFLLASTLLPNINGFKLSYLLKHDERYENTSIILLTSKEVQSEENIFKACKANHILKKPFKFSDLKHIMSLS
ncbi:MAG: PleD family two-component system response regulator [Candidatus Neomarinimicrobiota bacterium]